MPDRSMAHSHREDGIPPQTGTRLRREREARGRSITDLAASLGKSRAHLSAVELGTSRPSRALAEGYERELGLPPGTLTQLLEPARPDAGAVSTAMQEIVKRLEEDFRRKGPAPPPPGRPSAADYLRRDAAAAPSDVEVVNGRDAVLDRARALIAKAVEQPSPAQEPILVAYYAPIGERREVLREALAKGWRVEVAYRLHEREEGERLAIAQGLLSLAAVGKSRFGGYTLDPSLGGVEALVVPRSGAMLVLTTQSSGDTACVFDDNKHRRLIETLRAHVNYLIRGFGRPIIRFYEYERVTGVDGNTDEIANATGSLPLNHLRFNYALTDALAGDTYLVQDGLAITRLLPVALDTTRADRVLGARGREWLDFGNALLEQRAQQTAIFHQQLADGIKCFDLIGRPGIEALAKDGVARGDWLGVRLTLEERLVYLSSALDALRHPNYQIGLLAEAPPVFYLVTGRPRAGVVFFEAFQTAEGATDDGELPPESELLPDACVIELREEALAIEARKDFWHRWEQPGVERDKSAVVRYLGEKIEEVERLIAARGTDRG